MKTFDDLEFLPYGYSAKDFNSLCELELSDEDFAKELEKISSAKKAVINFSNGWGVSVLLGNQFYSNGVDTYEVGILKNGELCEDNPVFPDEVVGTLTVNEISTLMKKLQSL